MLKKRLEISRLTVTEDPQELHLRSIQVNIRRRKEKVRRNFIIVTAGLGLDDNDNFKLSYAFEAILKWVRSQIRDQDIIFIPPAPSYGAVHEDGQRKYEGDFAEEWLQKAGIPDRQIRKGSATGEHYLDGDTRRGNARGAKKAAKEQSLLSDGDNVLVVYFLQALRALTVFKQESVRVDEVAAIQPLNVPSDEKRMVPQLRYYDRWIHTLYEAMAFIIFATHMDEVVYEFAPGIRRTEKLKRIRVISCFHRSMNRWAEEDEIHR